MLSQIKKVWKDINDSVFEKAWEIPGLSFDESISDDENPQGSDDAQYFDLKTSILFWIIF